MRVQVTLQKRPNGIIKLVTRSFRPKKAETKERRGDAANLTKTTKCKIKPKRVFGVSPGFGGLPRRTAFSKKSATFVVERSAAIENAYTKENCRFLTYTIPGSSELIPEATARYSGWFTQQVNQWLRDTAPGVDFLYVWELQKRGVLHAHYLVAHSDVRELQKLEERFAEFIANTLNFLSDKTGIDFWERSCGTSWRGIASVLQVAVQKVHKSVSHYLAKYLSKQSRDLNSSAQLCPSRWWGSSKGAERLRKLDLWVAPVVSGDYSVIAPVVREALGLLSRVVGAAFSYVDPWRPFREVHLVRTSNRTSAIGTFAFLRASIADSTSHVPKPPLGVASLREVADFFKGTICGAGSPAPAVC